MQGLSPVPPRHQGPVTLDPDRPAYRVTEKRGFFDDMDVLWEKGSMLYWDGTPNPGFEPLNDLARKKMREYYEDLDAKGKEVAAARGMGHANMVNAFDAKMRLAEMDRKEGRAIGVEEQTPLMGAQRRGRSKATAINGVPQEVPLMGSQGHYSTAKVQSRGNKGRSEVNKAGDSSRGLL